MNKFWDELNQLVQGRGRVVFDDTIKRSLVVYDLDTTEDLELVAKELKSGTAVMVNFGYLSKRDKENAFYFCMGCAYSLGGTYYRIDSNVAVFTAKGIAIQNRP